MWAGQRHNFQFPTIVLLHCLQDMDSHRRPRSTDILGEPVTDVLQLAFRRIGTTPQLIDDLVNLPGSCRANGMSLGDQPAGIIDRPFAARAPVAPLSIYFPASPFSQNPKSS